MAGRMMHAEIGVGIVIGIGIEKEGLAREEKRIEPRIFVLSPG